MTRHFETVSTIDVAALFDERASSRPAVERQVAQTLAEHGGFVATGFPGGDDIDGRMQDLLAFFGLPAEVKMACATRGHDPASPHVYRGYSPPPEETGWAYNEVFDIGPDPVTGVPGDLPGREVLEEPTFWPSAEPHPGWCARSRALYDDLVGLCRGVLCGLLAGLDIDPAPALAQCARNNATLRLLNYPEVPAHFLAGQGEKDAEGEHADEFGRRILTYTHTDMNLVSLLWQDPVGGLQVRAPDGTWREVPADRGGVSIHNGTMIERVTGGRVAGTPHRVAGPSGNRRSVGMFHEPDYDALLPSSDGRPDETYARQLLRKLKTYPDLEPFLAEELAA